MKKQRNKKRVKLSGFSFPFIMVSMFSFFDKYPFKPTKLPLIDLFKSSLSIDNPFDSSLPSSVEPTTEIQIPQSINDKYLSRIFLSLYVSIPDYNMFTKNYSVKR